MRMAYSQAGCCRRTKMEMSGPDNPAPGEKLSDVPFVIGVVGHRDPLPAQVPDIRLAVQSMLRRLQACSGVRLQLLCAVADGIDLLAADVAMDLGIQIVALLTFPEDICRGDLLSDEARDQFDRVMSIASRQEVPLPDGVTRESFGANSPARDLQYQRAALQLARQCALLLAVWDGKPTRHAAGSARVIEYRERNSKDLVFEVRCARASDTAFSAGAPPPIHVMGYRGASTGFDSNRDAFEVPEALRRALQGR